VKSFVFSERADRSLDHIMDWSFEKFGQVQADRYRNLLVNRCEAIAAGTAHHQSCRVMFADDLREDLRFARAGNHFVIFVETPDEVLIVDFLHQSADIAGRLG
jgi:toxin ParE1/3/4